MGVFDTYSARGDVKEMTTSETREYQKAYIDYSEAKKKYSILEKAYHVLRSLGPQKDSHPYTLKIMWQIIEEARLEKMKIASHKGKCLRLLN